MMDNCKTIICLANSVRKGERCVAGIEYDNGQFGQWIRPISHRKDQAINLSERKYQDGTECKILDIMEINFDQHKPKYHQTENWLISKGVKWKKIGEVNSSDLQGAVLKKEVRLWFSEKHTRTGLSDEFSPSVAHSLKTSLALVRPEKADIEVTYDPYNNKKEVWVEFMWAENKYKIKLTDPIQLEQFTKNHKLHNPFLCVSLAQVWPKRNAASMLVAGLIL